MRKILLKSVLAASLIIGAANASDVVAVVNGKEITKSDVNQLLKAMPGLSFEKLNPELKQKVIEQAIERELLKQYAKKSGIENDEEYKRALSKIKDDLAVEVWMKKQYDSIKVTDREAKEFYNKNIDKFSRPQQVHARHILVKDENEARKIIEELKKSPKNRLKDKFIELAKSKSIGPSGKNGGDLGWFGKGQMVKPFSEAAFALKKGEITTSPVKTQFGYHIIYLEDKKEAGKIPFEDVKNKIKAELRMEKFQQIISKKAKELKKSAKIEKKI